MGRSKRGFKMIINLFDNEKYEYPLIEIEDKGFKVFIKQLELYKTQEAYNIDDFISILKNFDWFIRVINTNKEVYF